MGHLISTRTSQFSYFGQILKQAVWKGTKILDFGGNVGGFLTGARDLVDHKDYWCLDVQTCALEQGRRKFPGANFVHFNRYSSEFNPGGVRYLPVPDFDVRFDMILAFSVFTHIHQNEMLELVAQLRRRLARKGVIAFTFADPAYDRSLSDPDLPSGTDVRKNLEWRRVKNSPRDIHEIVERARGSRWCVLINEDLYVEPGKEMCHQERKGVPWESYCAYYAVDYMASLFPDATLFAPVSPEWQHCCVLRNA